MWNRIGKFQVEYQLEYLFNNVLVDPLTPPRPLTSLITSETSVFASVSAVLFLAAATALCLLYSISTYTKLLWMLLCSNYAWLLLHILPLLPTGIHLTKIYRDQLHYCAFCKMVLKNHKLFDILKSTSILSTEKYRQNHIPYQIYKSWVKSSFTKFS